MTGKHDSIDFFIKQGTAISIGGVTLRVSGDSSGIANSRAIINLSVRC